MQYKWLRVSNIAIMEITALLQVAINSFHVKSEYMQIWDNIFRKEQIIVLHEIYLIYSSKN